MKSHTLYITVRVEVQRKFENLSKTIAEFEKQTIYTFNSTQQVKILETEILLNESFNPLNN